MNGCMAVNIYFERDPSVDPSVANGCDNPPSTTNIKCVFWGGPVVIVGSNGYVNDTLVPAAGYSTAVDYGNSAINTPYDVNGYNTYMGSAIFNDGPFNAPLCADACSMKSTYALAHPPTDGSSPQTCQFFNTYILYINTTKNLQGQYCATYSETWSSSYATNNGQYRGNDHFLIEYSYGYGNSPNSGTPSVNAAVHQASVDISYATLQPFCSSYLDYTIRTTTTTATSTVIATTTITATTNAKRALTAEISGTTYTVPTLPPLSVFETMGLAGPNATVAQFQKRALQTSISTPAVLTKYPATVLRSACGMQATPATNTSTIIASTTTTYVSTVVASPTQVVRNPDFSSGTFDPWQTFSITGRMDFSLNNG